MLSTETHLAAPVPEASQPATVAGVFFGLDSRSVACVDFAMELEIGVVQLVDPGEHLFLCHVAVGMARGTGGFHRGTWLSRADVRILRRANAVVQRNGTSLGRSAHRHDPAASFVAHAGVRGSLHSSHSALGRKYYDVGRIHRHLLIIQLVCDEEGQFNCGVRWAIDRQRHAIDAALDYQFCNCRTARDL